MSLDGKTVLVTGGTGFLGHHVIERLKATKAREIAASSGRKTCDLTDPHDCSSLIQRWHPDVVIHLAANVGGIGYNAEHPAEIMRDNLLMAINLYEAVLDHRGKDCPIVTVGTACSYPTLPPPLGEEWLWTGKPEGPNAPYGVAKRAIVELSSAYWRQHEIKSVMLIPTNLYGPHDHFGSQASHVIPALIDRIVKAKETHAPTVGVWGSGEATRDFLYVEDAALGIVRAAERMPSAPVINLGSGEETSIAALVKMICEIVGYEGQVWWDESKLEGHRRRLLDTRRATKVLQWSASTPLREGLERTIASYMEGRKCAS